MALLRSALAIMRSRTAKGESMLSDKRKEPLWLYDWLSRFGFLNYRTKILLMAFVGTHIPLITLAIYFALGPRPTGRPSSPPSG
jgi:hypothetical protein